MSKTAVGTEGSSSGKEASGTLSDVYPLYAIGFLVQLGMAIVSPILPDLMREFSLAAWQAGMVVTMFGLARLVADLPLGFILHKVNRTAVLIVGTLLITSSAVACALARDYNMLLAARFVMGAGSAMCTVTALFSLSRAAESDSRGGAIGTYQAAMIAGTTLGPALGGMAAAFSDWRASFFFCAISGALAFLLVLIASSRGILKFSPARSKEDPQRESAGPAEASRIPWNLVAVNFTSLVLFFSMSGFRNTIVPVYGGNELGIGAGTLGLLLGGSALIRLAVTLFSGFASDRYGRKEILIPGILILMAGSLSFVLAKDLTGLVLCVVLISLGGFGNSVPTTMVVDAVPSARVGMAISVNRFVGDAGMLAGPVVLGLLLDATSFPTVAMVTAAILLTTVPGVALAVQRKMAPRAGSAKPLVNGEA